MSFPLSTGEAARILDVTEPRLAELVRRGRLTEAPPIVAGRRLWARRHLVEAASRLGVWSDRLSDLLGSEALS